MFYDRLKELCDKRDVKISGILRKHGLSSGNLVNWKKGTSVNSDILCKFADYFGVSVDYLLGRTDNPKMRFLKRNIGEK